MVANEQNLPVEKPPRQNITLVIFASDQGPGDAERTAIMSEAGNLLAKHVKNIICLAENDILPLSLLTSARLAGANVELICDKQYSLPKALNDVKTQIIEMRDERLRALGAMADCFVGLPGSLASVTSHFFTIAELGADKPMVFLNKNRAYEIVRGFSADVFAHSFPKAHRNVQFVDTVEEIWPKIEKLTAEQ